MGRLGADLDGDGVDEFLGAIATEQSKGGIRVFSGRTGRGVLVVSGEVPGEGLGTGDVTGCGDIDGDGVVDFLGSSDGSLKPGVVTVFSGRDGSRLFTWRKQPGSGYGDRVAAGDLDLDGTADLLIYVSPCNGNQGVEWRSLRDGQVITQVCIPGTNTQFGNYLLIGRPQPGNPFPVFLVQENRFGTNFFFGTQGRIHLLRSSPPGVTGLGPACAGTLPAAPQMGLTDLGAAGVRLHLSGAPAGTIAYCILGLSSTSWLGLSLPYPLDSLGFLGCTLQTSIEIALPRTTGVGGIDRGYASLPLQLPLATGAPQITLYGQWLVLGSGPLAPGGATGGLTWSHSLAPVVLRATKTR